MEARAKIKHLRITPRKVRLVVDQIRGLDAAKALAILDVCPRPKISEALSKLLNSAIANAQENMNLDVDKLYIKEIMVDKGPVLKRWLPRMRGKADRLLKRSCKVSLVLDEKEN